MVPVLGILRRPCHTGSPVTFPVRANHGNRNFRKRTRHVSVSFSYLLIFEQNQRKVYHEVLIAGDLSREDSDRAAGLTEGWSAFLYGRSTSDTAEFIYGNDTVYFAQPSLSQFVPGGYGAGTFNQSASVGLKGVPNDTLLLTGKNAPKSNTGVVLRYAPPTHEGRSSTQRYSPSFRYPQWGIRIHCEKLPDPEVNL